MIRLLHLFYNIYILHPEKQYNTLCAFYSLIKHGFLTNQSTRKVTNQSTRKVTNQSTRKVTNQSTRKVYIMKLS